MSEIEYTLVFPEDAYKVAKISPEEYTHLSGYKHVDRYEIGSVSAYQIGFENNVNIRVYVRVREEYLNALHL